MSLQLFLIGILVAAGLLVWWGRQASPLGKGMMRVVLGLALCALATAVYAALVQFACAMDPTGCVEASVGLYLRQLRQEEGIVYLGLMAIGLWLIGSGLRRWRAVG